MEETLGFVGKGRFDESKENRDGIAELAERLIARTQRQILTSPTTTPFYIVGSFSCLSIVKVEYASRKCGESGLHQATIGSGTNPRLATKVDCEYKHDCGSSKKWFFKVVDKVKWNLLDDKKNWPPNGLWYFSILFVLVVSQGGIRALTQYRWRDLKNKKTRMWRGILWELKTNHPVGLGAHIRVIRANSRKYKQFTHSIK